LSQGSLNTYDFSYFIEWWVFIIIIIFNFIFQEIGETSTKIITFIDLAGHQKYLKTTISALTGQFLNKLYFYEYLIVCIEINELYCTVLYCTVLYCTALYCTALYCTVQDIVLIMLYWLCQQLQELLEWLRYKIKFNHGWKLNIDKYVFIKIDVNWRNSFTQMWLIDLTYPIIEFSNGSSDRLIDWSV